jgi:hypothetical protein
VYVDATEGWKNVQDSTSNVTGNAFIVATGGTITCDGNYKIHTFTGPGTFIVTSCRITNPGSNNSRLFSSSWRRCWCWWSRCWRWSRWL